MDTRPTLRRTVRGVQQCYGPVLNPKRAGKGGVEQDTERSVERTGERGPRTGSLYGVQTRQYRDGHVGCRSTKLPPDGRAVVVRSVPSIAHRP